MVEAWSYEPAKQKKQKNKNAKKKRGMWDGKGERTLVP